MLVAKIIHLKECRAICAPCFSRWIRVLISVINPERLRSSTHGFCEICESVWGRVGYSLSYVFIV